MESQVPTRASALGHKMLLGLVLLVAACGAREPSEEGVAPVAAPQHLGEPDAGEGAKAKKEEGKVGNGPSADTQSRTIDLRDAENIPIDLSHLGGDALTPTQGVGGLIGNTGTQIGSGGLGSRGGGQSGGNFGAKGEGGIGSRGGGLGGGGSAEGLSGLGTKGMGSGASGYGQGGGNFGSVGYGEVVPSAPQGSEQFTDHGVGGFAITEHDRVSTFSVDVDTGSYTISRRKLREGSLPPQAAVRVEEFVNYIDYSYAPPQDDAPFRVHTELAPHPFVPSHQLLRVGIKGKEMPTANRPPVHLTFLVDVSGSMASADKLPLAQQSLHYLVDNLGPEDTVAIATYAGGERRVLEPTHTTRATVIHDAIDTLRSGGGTAMESGMVLAYDMAQSAYLQGAENRVIVLSDGDANIGRSGHTDILETISKYAGRGITMSTIGFGMGNYKDTVMEQLADKGDGNYAYVDSMEEAKKVFGTDLAGTIRTIARDVKIQVDFDPAAVHSYRLIGYENRDIADKDFRNDKVDAGEVGSGHQVTALYELILANNASGPLATVRLRAKPAGKDAAAKEWAVPVANLLAGGGFDGAGKDLRLAFGVASFAEILRGSPHAAETSYDDVLRIVRAASDPEREDHRELVELIERAKALSAGAPAVAGAGR